MPPSPPPAPIRLASNNVWPFALDASEGGGWGLIDAGADGAIGGVEAWTALVEQARGLGFAPRDVRAVVVTHEHIDHTGLAARWAAQGARIVAARAAMPMLRAGLDGYHVLRAARVEELRRHGCPEDALEAVASAGLRIDLAWEPCPAHALDEAEERSTFALAEGRTLRLVATPGHTPGHLVAFVEETGDLCSGDALLPDTIPTPGLHFPAVVEGDALRGPGAAPRWPSLPPFLASVEAIAAMAPRRILPGHGEIVDDPARLIARFRAHHARLAEQVRAALEGDALAGGGAKSAYEIARAIFPRLPAARVAQAMTEVIGHLDVLEAAGVVRRDAHDGTLRHARLTTPTE